MSESQLRAMADAAYASAHFMVLGTTEADGRARVSPVYHERDGDDLYWISAPTATHSVNLARDHPRGGARAFTPEDLSGDRVLRLYRLTAGTVEVHLPGGHPLGGPRDGRGLVPPAS